VLQETFLEVVKSIRDYRGERAICWGWIRRIAASKALMRIRREQLRATEPLGEELGKPGMHVGANIDLERAFEQLTDTSARWCGCTTSKVTRHEEIGELMGKSVSFSKSQLARAHARLRGMLGAGEGAQA